MNWRARAILWLDSGAAFVVGLTTLVLRDWITGLYAFPRAVILFVAAANLVYSSYSGALAALATFATGPARRAVDVLVIANLAWAAVCVGLLGVNWRSAHALGLAQVACEAVFVVGLAAAEYRYVRPLAR